MPSPLWSLLQYVEERMQAEREASRKTAQAISALGNSAKAQGRYEELPKDIRKRFERITLRAL